MGWTPTSGFATRALRYGHRVAEASDKQSASASEGAGHEKWTDPKQAQRLLEQWGSQVGRTVAVAAARMREEAEDIWAEAQSVRRGERD